MALSRIAGMLVVPFLAGCIAVPIPLVPDPHPYPAAELAYLEVGRTTRDDVLAQHGSPYKELGPWWIFYASRYEVGFRVCAASMGGEVGCDLVDRELKTYFLAVKFDASDVVEGFEVFSEDFNGCKKSGICCNDGFVQLEERG